MGTTRPRHHVRAVNDNAVAISEKSDSAIRRPRIRDSPCSILDEQTKTKTAICTSRMLDVTESARPANPIQKQKRQERAHLAQNRTLHKDGPQRQPRPNKARHPAKTKSSVPKPLQPERSRHSRASRSSRRSTFDAEYKAPEPIVDSSDSDWYDSSDGYVSDYDYEGDEYCGWVGRVCYADAEDPPKAKPSNPSRREAKLPIDRGSKSAAIHDVGAPRGGVLVEKADDC